MPNHTNHHGTLFGGHALGLMDHAGWVAATRCARRTMVTVASDRVEFKVPVRAGQLVELVARVTRVGRTSVTVGVDMFAEDVATGERTLATSGSFVFVAIGDDGRPVPVEDALPDRCAARTVAPQRFGQFPSPWELSGSASSNASRPRTNQIAWTGDVADVREPMRASSSPARSRRRARGRYWRKPIVHLERRRERT